MTPPLPTIDVAPPSPLRIAAMCRAILLTLEAHGGIATFTRDEAFLESAPLLKKSGYVISGGAFYHVKSGTYRETLSITATGQQKLKEAL